MAYLPTWNEWRALREDNARKRAVRAALAGTGPDMPGSDAACPSTNPRAMKSAKKNGVVTKLPISEEEKTPNYSFDKWLQKAEKLGDDLNKMKKDSDSEESKLSDKEKTIDKDVEKNKEKIDTKNKKVNKWKQSIKSQEKDGDKKQEMSSKD